MPDDGCPNSDSPLVDSSEESDASNTTSSASSSQGWSVSLLLVGGSLFAASWLHPYLGKHTRTSTDRTRQLVQPEHPINAFNDQLDSATFEGTGLYYEFETANSELILSGEVEGRKGNWVNASTPLPLASSSKLWTGFAAMLTMELKPKDFYPEKQINTFKGWEEFGNFLVHPLKSKKRANLTIHQLLTHTSGLPFAMRDSKKDLQNVELFYMPGTAFGYTLGHRVCGWLLRDFWMQQPEGKRANLKTVQDVYKWLVFDRLGLSKETRFDPLMTTLFGYSGGAGDAAIQSTGEDMLKLAVVALRRGQTPDGRRLISEANWNKWAVPNLLPGGKLSEDLVGWESVGANWANFNVGGLKEGIMKQNGAYGWNYFGATYKHGEEIGWCGFFSSCLRVSYTRDVAFVMMQRDTADMKKSKPYLVEHYDSMAKSLECSQKTCNTGRSSSVFCEMCETTGILSSSRSCKDHNWSPACPTTFSRSKSLITSEVRLNADKHACYVPSCRHEPKATADQIRTGLAARGSTLEGTLFESTQVCYASLATSCRFSSCDTSLGATCMGGVCGCIAGCAGADGKCHEDTTNLLVAANFGLANVKDSKYRLYVKSMTFTGQLKTTDSYEWMNAGKDRFSLFRLPGNVSGMPRFLLGSVAWPDTVATIGHTRGTSLLSLHAFYATSLKKGWSPDNLSLLVCALRKPAGAIMIGTEEGHKKIWAYTKFGSWKVYGYQKGDPKEGGYWMPDPPIPAGVLPPCPTL